MSREILLLVDALAREKGVEPGIVFEALEGALASAMRRVFTEDVDIRVEIDRESGDYVGYRWRLVVPDEAGLQEADRQELLSDAQTYAQDVQVGDYIEEELEHFEFGRIGAQAAKQAILQRIRDAEREQMLNEFLERDEKVIMGSVKRLDRGDAISEVGKLEARLPRSELIPREIIRAGDSVRAWVKRSDTTDRGRQVLL